MLPDFWHSTAVWRLKTSPVCPGTVAQLYWQGKTETHSRRSEVVINNVLTTAWRQFLNSSSTKQDMTDRLQNGCQLSYVEACSSRSDEKLQPTNVRDPAAEMLRSAGHTPLRLPTHPQWYPHKREQYSVCGLRLQPRRWGRVLFLDPIDVRWRYQPHFIRERRYSLSPKHCSIFSTSWWTK